MISQSYLILVVGLLGGAALAQAAAPTSMQQLINDEHQKCESGTDSMACIKVRAMRFIDTVLSKDDFKIADVEFHANGLKRTVQTARSATSGSNFMDAIENYLQGHDVTMDLPTGDAKVTVSSRNLANNELSFNFKFANDDNNDVDVVEGKGKKNRMRKMIMPIMVLILLKAMTVIPMAIGILKIKAFNALALGFFSFIVSVGLAIFQLCKKLASEHHHAAHITAHGPWDGRSISSPTANIAYPTNTNAHEMAYQAYA